MTPCHRDIVHVTACMGLIVVCSIPCWLTLAGCRQNTSAGVGCLRKLQGPEEGGRNAANLRARIMLFSLSLTK